MTALERSMHQFGRMVRRQLPGIHGRVVLRASGRGGGDFLLDFGAGGVHVGKAGAAGSPDLEVLGTAARIKAVLDGRKRPLPLIYADGLRVRGNARFITALARDLGWTAQ